MTLAASSGTPLFTNLSMLWLIHPLVPNYPIVAIRCVRFLFHPFVDSFVF